jgi:hypothetical protein
VRKYLVLTLAPRLGLSIEQRAPLDAMVIEDHQLEDTISEDDAWRFRKYAVAGDYYEYGDLVVVALGRGFSETSADDR